LKPEVLHLREEALRLAQLKDPEEAEICLSPKDYPCPEICHPVLPDFSIYDIPHLTRNKKLQLLENGINSAKDIPSTFDLNDIQRLVADCARTNTEYIDKTSLHAELDRL
jgi:hypothetical protein